MLYSRPLVPCRLSVGGRPIVKYSIFKLTSELQEQDLGTCFLRSVTSEYVNRGMVTCTPSAPTHGTADYAGRLESTILTTPQWTDGYLFLRSEHFLFQVVKTLREGRGTGMGMGWGQ